MPERGADDELALVAMSLPMVTRLNLRLAKMAYEPSNPGFYDRPEVEWLADIDTFMATLDSVWIRARHLLHFLLGWGRGDVVKASDYLQGWVLPDGVLRADLIAYERQASKIVAHLLRRPDAPSGLSAAMPMDLIAGFYWLLAAAPDGHVLRDVLTEPMMAADQAMSWIHEQEPD